MPLLRVVTPATATRLTTPSAVAERMDEPAPSAMTGMLIEGASSVISLYCRRVFGRETVTETWRRSRDNSHMRGEALILARNPVMSVTSVVIDDTTIDPALIEVDPDGLLYHLAPDGGYDISWLDYDRSWHGGWYGGVTTVTYVAGWRLPGEDGRDLPAAYEEAAIMTVVGMARSAGRDPTLRGVTTDGVGSYQFNSGRFAPDIIPPQAQSLLLPAINYRG